MADQRERIVLEIDETEALAAQKRVNAEIDKSEKLADKAIKTVGRSAESESRAILTVTDRSRSAIERTLASLEKRASSAGKTGAEKLIAERESTIRRIGGDERAVERVKTAYDRLIASQEKHISLGQRIANAIRSPLQAGTEALDGFLGKLGTVAIVGSAAAAGIGFVAKAAFDLVAEFGRSAEQAVNMGERLGITATEAERLSAMSEIAGVDVGGFETAMRALSEALIDGSEQGQKGHEALQKMGVSAITSRGALRPMIDIIRDVAAGLSRIQNPAERVQAATRLLGRGALELLPLIRNFEELEKIVIKVGTGADEKLVQGLARADDWIGILKLNISNMRKELAGAIVDFANFFNLMDRGGPNANRQPFLPGAIPHANQFDPGLGGFKRGASESRLARRQEIDDVRRGNEAIEKFRAGQSRTDEGLKAALKEIQQRRATAEAGIRPGLAEDVALKRIAEVKQLTAQERSLEAQIKVRSEAEQKADAARKAFETHRKALPDAQTKAFAEVERETRKAQQERFGEEAKAREDTNRQIRDSIQERVSVQAEMEAAAIEARRDHELAVIASTTNQSLQSRITQIRRRAEVEARAQQELADLELRRIAEVQQRELDSILFINDTRLKQGIITLEQYQAAVDAFTQRAGAQAQQIAERTSAAQAATRERAVNQEAELIRDAHLRAFESVKRGAEGLLDQLLTRTKSAGDILKAILVAAVLTPLKDAASTFIATLLTGVRPTGGGGFAGGGGGGLLGRLGGFGGLLGGGAPTIFGAGSITGGPGGTGKFAGPVGGGGGAAGLAGFAPLAGIKGFLSGLGNIGAPVFGAGSSGGAMAGGGVYGAKGGAMLAGGGILALDGLRRGGLLGLAETTAGGALIGAKFGGPVGAAIGAGIGAVAGTIRLFIRGAESKIVDKIKSVYGLTISKQFARDPLLPIIKQQFGGNIDVGIRSPAVRDLIELYAMSTDQPTAGLVNRVQPVSLAQSNGVITQIPNFFNGAPLSTGGGPTGSTAAGPGTVVVQLDPEATTALLRGQAAEGIRSNPSIVSGSVAAALKGSSNRRQIQALNFAPGTLTS